MLSTFSVFSACTKQYPGSYAVYEILHLLPYCRQGIWPQLILCASIKAKSVSDPSLRAPLLKLCDVCSGSATRVHLCATARNAETAQPLHPPPPPRSHCRHSSSRGKGRGTKKEGEYISLLIRDRIRPGMAFALRNEFSGPGR